MLPCLVEQETFSRPSPPRNCTSSRLLKNSEPTLSVRCLAGYDGGLTQHFTLEAGHRTLANTTGLTDLVVWLNVSWSVLESLGEEEELAVIARNSKGASDPVILRELGFRNVAKRAESTTRAESKFPVAAAFAALAAILAAAGAIVAVVLRRRSVNNSSSKRPSQSVVQVDAQGRRYLIAYPPDKPDTKPDILNPKAESEPPRVVLESTDNKSYTIREAPSEVHKPPYFPHQPGDDVVPQR